MNKEEDVLKRIEALERRMDELEDRLHDHPLDLHTYYYYWQKHNNRSKDANTVSADGRRVQ